MLKFSTTQLCHPAHTTKLKVREGFKIMIQFKFYDYFPKNIDINTLQSSFPESKILPCPKFNIIGVEFTRNNIKKIADQAYKFGFEPVIFNHTDFYNLIKAIPSTDGRIFDLQFDLPVEKSFRRNLANLLSSPNFQNVSLALLDGFLKSSENFIDCLSWYYNKSELFCFRIEASGKLLLGRGYESLVFSKGVLDSVFYCYRKGGRGEI